MEIQDPDSLNNATDIPLFTPSEVGDVLRSLPNGKASGPDDVPNEFLKILGPKCTEALTNIFNNMLTTGNVPAAWSEANVRLIYKGKGKDAHNLASYRPISLLNTLYKVMATLLKIRLNTILENTNGYGDMQYGFRHNRSTKDSIFIFTQLIELAKQRGHPLYCAMIDIKAAYDSVDRDKQWKRLKDSGIPETYLKLVKGMYTNTSSRYFWEDVCTSSIKNNIGLRQGCPLSPLLFATYLKPLETSLDEANLGFKLSLGKSCNAVFFADDILLFAETSEDLQTQLDQATTYAETYNLTFCKNKSEIFIYNSLENKNMNFKLQGESISTKDTVTYLGVSFSSNSENYLQKEIEKRTEKARKFKYLVKAHSRGTFNRYTVARTLWKQVAVPTLTYANEVLCFPKEMWNILDKQQLEIGRYAVGASYISPNITIETELGWSPFGKRDDISKSKYMGELMQRKNETKIKEIHDFTKQMKHQTSWHKSTRLIRYKYELGTNLIDHPTKEAWNKDTVSSINRANEKRWENEARKKTSLHVYGYEYRTKPDGLYDNTIGSDLLYQARVGSLPTKKRHHEIFQENPSCPLCNAQEEDIPHILLQCPALDEARTPIQKSTHGLTEKTQ